MSRFSPIPAKVHKPKRRVRRITAQPIGYKPRLRKLTYRREATPVAHRRTFFVSKRKPVQRATHTYKYTPEVNVNWKFVFLLLLLAVLVAGAVMLFMFLNKE